MKQKVQPSRWPTSKVSDKYQLVIPKAVRTVLRIRRGSLVRWTPIGKDRLVVEPIEPARPQRNWTEHMAGLGKRVWEGVDTTEYLSELRDEPTDYQKKRGIVR